MRTQKSPQPQHLHSVPPPAMTAQVTPVATPFDALAAEARRAAPADVRWLAADLSSLHAKVQSAVAVVSAERAKLDAARVPVRWSDIEGLPLLALAYGEAVSRVAALDVSTPSSAALWNRYWSTRAKLLDAADVLIAWKGVPASPIDTLRRATRRNLSAYDMPRIAGWFREHAAVLQGCSPVTEADLVAAEALGDEVLRARRAGVPMAPSSALLDAKRTRDALGWMLRDRYEHLSSVAGWLWPRDLRAHVPGLTGRTRGAKRTPPAPPAPPVDTH